MNSSNPNFSKFRKIFKKALAEATANCDHLANQDKDFSRNRKLDRLSCAEIPYKLQERSIQSKLPTLFPNTPEVTASAVSQARSKIKSSLYIDVFEMFNSSTEKYDIKKYKGYRLVAHDGSEVRFRHGDPVNYSRCKNGTRRYFKHANCTYDVLNQTFVDCLLQPGSKKNEDAALLELAIKRAGEKMIFTCDRGYESLSAFWNLDQAGVKFVIRIKDQQAYNSILKYYPTPDTEEYDIPYTPILTSSNSKASLMKNRGFYKYINPKKQSIQFPCDITELPLNLRIVRFWAKSEGNRTLMTVITNLDPEEFSTEDIKEIYRLRWQEEIGFRTLKGAVALECIHSRKEEHIVSEIYAKLTLYNLFSRIRNALEEKKRKKKHVHKIDFTFAINTIWDNLFRVRPSKGIDDLIRKHTQPERPNRADPRKKKIK